MVMPEKAGSTVLITPSSSLKYGIDLPAVTIGSDSTSGSFRIGVASNITSPSFIVEWTFDLVGYMPIKQLIVKVTTQGLSTILLPTIGGIPAGGRIGPLYFQIPTPPYDDLTISLRISGYYPTFTSIYPSILSFAKNQSTNYFWISVGK